MSEFKRPQTAEDFAANFEAKKPLMAKNEAYYESSRCLYCYDAPCINACPTGIDIPLFIKQIQTGNVEGAAQTIFDSNWMGNACGKVCPTEELCEGACVYNHMDQKPLEIGRLQNYATDKVISGKKRLYAPGSATGKRIAIVGAGPAGLACASELRLLGHEAVIFEAKSLASGLTVYGTAPYKITNEEALAEVNWLQDQFGFEIRYNSPVSPEDLSKLEHEFDAVFLGVGLGATARLGIPGEDLPNVEGAVEFVERLRMNQHSLQIPERVVVLGGGNTAMDAASESARMGASEVHLVYRRGREGMGAYAFEYETVLKAGVRSVFHASPKRILPEGVELIRTRDTDSGLEEIPGSEFVLEADLVIKATGQAKCLDLLKAVPDLKLDSKNRVIVNASTYQTSNPRYFAGGDAVNGGAEVVNGAFDGKMAAKGIHLWLTQNS
jgi:dihydropyrimidine dehydrogenase (NAD+) subunit PreT